MSTDEATGMGFKVRKSMYLHCMTSPLVKGPDIRSEVARETALSVSVGGVGAGADTQEKACWIFEHGKASKVRVSAEIGACPSPEEPPWHYLCHLRLFHRTSSVLIRHVS